MVGTFLEPSCGRRHTPIHSIHYSVAQPLERGSNNYYSIIQGGTDIEVFLILPRTQQGKKELEKTLARCHAEHAQKMIEKMPCPTEQKLELVDAVVNVIKAEKKAAKA